MDHPSRNLEDNRTETPSEAQLWRPNASIFRGGRGSGVDIGHRVRDYPGNILTKQMAAFCLLSKNLPEAKLNSNGLISSAEFRSAYVRRLSHVVVGNQYYGRQVTKSQWDKKKFKMYSLKIKSNKKVNVGAKACAEGDEELRRGLMLITHSNKESGTLRARCPPAKLPTRERKRPKGFSGPKKEQIKGIQPMLVVRLGQCRSGLAGFKVMKSTPVKGFWSLPPWLRRATDIREVSA